MASPGVSSQAKAQELIDEHFPGRKAIGGFAAQPRWTRRHYIMGLGVVALSWLPAQVLVQIAIEEATSNGSLVRMAILLALALVVVVGVSAVATLLERRYRPSATVIVTDAGLAVGIKESFKSGMRWRLRPDQGHRFEVDPDEVHEAEMSVELTIDGKRFFTAGPARDEAFRLYPLQPSASKAVLQPAIGV